MSESAPARATPRNQSFQRARTLIIWLLLLGIIVAGGSNCWILEVSRGRVYTDTSAIPENDVGLVLGTSSSLPGGHSNSFFTGRIAAAAELRRQSLGGQSDLRAMIHLRYSLDMVIV